MTHPALDRAVLSSRLMQTAQLMGTYDSKTDQTAQSDQRLDLAEEFGALREPKLTSRHPKLTSGTVQRSNPALQVLGIPVNSAHCRPALGTPSP